MYHLIVREPFHGYAKGQRVSDPDEIARLSHMENHFVRVPADDPAPVDEPAPDAPSAV